MLSVHVWDQVTECILPGCDRAGFSSHPFLRKFMYMSPGRNLNSELPEWNSHSLPPNFFFAKKNQNWRSVDGGTCGSLA